MDLAIAVLLVDCKPELCCVTDLVAMIQAVAGRWVYHQPLVGLTQGLHDELLGAHHVLFVGPHIPIEAVQVHPRILRDHVQHSQNACSVKVGQSSGQTLW